MRLPDPESTITGSACRTSWLTTSWVREFWMSTTGEAPVTVTVSSTDPTAIEAFTVAENAPSSTMPSRFTVLKPGRVNVTV
jgi:hypothetical protein